MLEKRAVGLCADSFNADVGTEKVGRLLDPLHDVIDLREVDHFGVRERAGKLEAVINVIDNDDAPRAHQPRGFSGKQTDGTGAEHDDNISFANLSELRAEIASGTRIGQHDGVFFVHPFGDLAWADVGKRHTNEFRLAAVVPATTV